MPKKSKSRKHSKAKPKKAKRSTARPAPRRRKSPARQRPAAPPAVPGPVGQDEKVDQASGEITETDSSAPATGDPTVPNPERAE